MRRTRRCAPPPPRRSRPSVLSPGRRGPGRRPPPPPPPPAPGARAPIGAGAGSAGPRLLTLFERDPDAIVRRAAGAAAARIQPGSPTLISTAARVLLHDEEPRVREVAAATLVEAGTSSMAAMPAARQGMHDRDPMVRVYAAAVVARLGSPESAVPVLLDLLHASDTAVRAEAAGFLADAAPADA